MSTALATQERLQEALTMTLEERSPGYQDLVSNSNVILHTLKQHGAWQTFDGGATIRETLRYGRIDSYKRYSQMDFLNPKTGQIFNDAEFHPKLAAVSLAIPMEEVLKNSGGNMIKDLVAGKIEAAEDELVDKFVEDLHGSGSLENQIAGLQAAIPTINDSGMYGGIDRGDHAVWRTGSYDVASDIPGVTEINKDTVKKIFRHITIEHMRGNDCPYLIVCSTEHYNAYAEALEGIQRITNENSTVGKGGFTHLIFNGAGKEQIVTLEGGKGSSMPANTSYFISPKNLKVRMHSARNFTQFGNNNGPTNQDGIVRHVGFFGNLTMNNPLFMAKAYG